MTFARLLIALLALLLVTAPALRVDGRKVYRIKILTKNGRVKRTQIDARSGRTESRGR